MNKGFSLLEFTISLSLTLGLLSVILTTIAESKKSMKKQVAGKENLEALFFAIDVLKFDIQNCGSYLQRCAKKIKPLETDENNFLSLLIGTTANENEQLFSAGSRQLCFKSGHGFKKDDSIIICSDEEVFSNRVAECKTNQIILEKPIKINLPPGSSFISLKTVEYRLFRKEKRLKRKVNSGVFQPILENVTDFYCSYLKESNALLYRIEINSRQQVRNFLFLPNLITGDEQQ